MIDIRPTAVRFHARLGWRDSGRAGADVTAVATFDDSDVLIRETT